jgi:ABC-2 type transport system permease protein
MQRSVARREGSPFTGLGPVFMKEFADHLSSARMMVLMLFVIVFGALPVGLSLQELRNVTESDLFLFLRIFTSAPQHPVLLHRFAVAGDPAPGDRAGLRCGEQRFNRRTLSRVLSQPIYRDALLLGKFLGALATLAVALVALWLIVLGAGLLLLGLPPRGVEVARGIGFLVVAIAYGGVWLAVSILFSVIFRSTATSALCALGVWLFFTILWPLVVPVLVLAVTPTDVAMGMGRLDETLAMIEMQSMLERLSPNTLFGEAVIGLLNPETRTLGPIIPSQMRGAIMAALPPFDQSLILIWPQITGLIAGMIVVFRRLRGFSSARKSGPERLDAHGCPLSTRTGATRSAARMAGRAASSRICGSMPSRCRASIPTWSRWRPVTRPLPGGTSTIDILLKSNLPGRWSVKDSFNTLDPSRRGSTRCSTRNGSGSCRS